MKERNYKSILYIIFIATIIRIMEVEVVQSKEFACV